MKTIFPLAALLSAAFVAAGPIPQTTNLDTRFKDLVHAANQARTEPTELAPPAAPAPADGQAGKHNPSRGRYRLT
jgi:hypothetical protein